jgi:hypothetical protein
VANLLPFSLLVFVPLVICQSFSSGECFLGIPFSSLCLYGQLMTRHRQQMGCSSYYTRSVANVVPWALQPYIRGVLLCSDHVCLVFTVYHCHFCLICGGNPSWKWPALGVSFMDFMDLLQLGVCIP